MPTSHKTGGFLLLFLACTAVYTKLLCLLLWDGRLKRALILCCCQNKEKIMYTPETIRKLSLRWTWLCGSIGKGGHARAQVLSIISVTSEEEEEEKEDRGREKGEVLASGMVIWCCAVKLLSARSKIVWGDHIIYIYIHLFYNLESQHVLLSFCLGVYLGHNDGWIVRHHGFNQHQVERHSRRHPHRSCGHWSGVYRSYRNGKSPLVTM